MHGASLHKQTGFTLVELVAVMVIAGILAIGSTLFISQAVKGVSDTAERQQVASIAWVVSEKVSRDLRNALPDSVRLGSSGGSDVCLEFIPTIAGTYYLSIPFGVAGPSAEVMEFQNINAVGNNDRLAVYSRDVASNYNLNNPGAISSVISSVSTGSTSTVNFTSDFEFQDSSPQSRAYLVTDPVAYCFIGGVLNRYQDYGFNGNFAVSNLANPVVIATGMQSGSFEYDGSALSKNATVSLQTRFALAGGQTFDFDQEVQIRNVP
jgi:MSHA biogenesis protein MshO